MILPSLLVPLKSTADNNSAIDLIVLAAFCRFLPLPHWPICCNERQKAGEPPPVLTLFGAYGEISAIQSFTAGKGEQFTLITLPREHIRMIVLFENKQCFSINLP